MPDTDPTTGEAVELPQDEFDDPSAKENPDQTADPLPGSVS